MTTAKPSIAELKRRESRLLLKLQRDHGYMFAAMLRERDSYTTQVRGIRSGKLTMMPSRVLRVIVPDGSWLAEQSMSRKPRTARRSKRKVRP